jgi:A/G-specific adenine glycosylase
VNLQSKIRNQKSKIRDLLLTWFRINARDLPWRHDRSAYRVWLSEMMLQQTQVDTVIPYFHRFLDRFPTLNDLAHASVNDVLKLWEGLGYYARARNMHKAAIKIVTELNGEFPQTVDGLLELPGIGRYTAGAIASLAFDVDAPVLDGNVIRVLCRLFAIKRNPKEPQVKENLWGLAEALIPKPLAKVELKKRLSAPTPSQGLAQDRSSPNNLAKGSRSIDASHLQPSQGTSHLQPFNRLRAGPPRGTSGEFNEALMELGALICTPRSPKCDRCPLNKICLAKKQNLQDQLPIKIKRKPVPHYQVTAAVIRKGNRLLIAQRPFGGRLGGLWEFPGGKEERGETLPQCLRREIKEELGFRIKVGKFITSIDHAYTHFTITLHAFECTVVSGTPRALGVEQFKWVRMKELDEYAFAKTDLKIIERLRADKVTG